MKLFVTLTVTCLLALFLSPADCPAEEGPGRAALGAGANNAFATDLYGALRTEEGNLFFSPYSVWAAMKSCAISSRSRFRCSTRPSSSLPG